MQEVAGDDTVFELGYWTAEPHIMRQVATLGAAAATWAAFLMPRVQRVEIHCDVANTVSGRIPRRLGFQLLKTLPRPATAPGEAGQELINVCERRWYPKTYAHRLWVEERRT